MRMRGYAKQDAGVVENPQAALETLYKTMISDKIDNKEKNKKISQMRSPSEMREAERKLLKQKAKEKACGYDLLQNLILFWS